MTDLTKLTAEELLRELSHHVIIRPKIPEWHETRRRLERLEQCERLKGDAEFVANEVTQEYRKLEKRLEQYEAAISDAFDPEGCACIKDMPGDNYTCTAHQTLYKIAREIAARAAVEETK